MNLGFQHSNGQQHQLIHENACTYHAYIFSIKNDVNLYIMDNVVVVMRLSSRCSPPLGKVGDQMPLGPRRTMYK